MLLWTLGCMYLFELRVFSGYVPSNEMFGSSGNSSLSFLRNLYIFLHSGCISNLHFHQQHRRVPFSPHTLKHLLLVDFSMMILLTSLRWYFLVVLICISLVISCVSIISCACWPSSLEKCLFKSSAHFFIGLFVF